MSDEPVASTDGVLPVAADAVAPGGSLVRLLAQLPAGGLAHVELAAGEVSVPQRHRTVREIWHVERGLGRMWRVPPWPGEGEACQVEGPWEPLLLS